MVAIAAHFRPPVNFSICSPLPYCLPSSLGNSSIDLELFTSLPFIPLVSFSEKRKFPSNSSSWATQCSWIPRPGSAKPLISCPNLDRQLVRYILSVLFCQREALIVLHSVLRAAMSSKAPGIPRRIKLPSESSRRNPQACPLVSQLTTPPSADLPTLLPRL